ncbi:DUF5819 family protein [Streptomyces sp. NPDC058231]|uniref:DUF5819 family protein n=1 Tax=Streptomyces sp. NPDC058231 TaxID=3346392 RepID=UPI0036EE6720
MRTGKDKHAPTGHAPAGAGRHHEEPPDHAGGSAGMSGLSSVSVTVVVLAVVGVLVGAAVHLVMLFFSIAPSNPFSQRHATGINKYVAPEFVQGWRLFAPAVPAENTQVQARAKVLKPNATSATDTAWVDLTAKDQAQIVHNPFPSHSQQNQLRLAWANFVDSLDNQGRPVGKIGNLNQQYLLRIAAQRLGSQIDGGTVLLLQLRSASTPVAAPRWSNQHFNTQTNYFVQPWWIVTPKDFK